MEFSPKLLSPAILRRHLFSTALACAVAGSVFCALPAAAQMQSSQAQSSRNQDHQAWRGMTVPGYPGAAGTSIKADLDEYTLYFKTDDDVRKVFDFYQRFLQQQGFTVVSSRARQNSRKAEMHKQGDRSGSRVELDVKYRPVHTMKVEIEFDD